MLSIQTATMSSVEIAELVDVRHDSVKRAMERLKESTLITFTPMVGKPTGGRPSTSYHVNEDDSYLVVAQLSPTFMAKIIKRWRELEANQFKIPQTFVEALQLATDQALELEKAAPKIEFVDKYVASGDTKTISDVAKMLNIPNRTFFRYLKEDNILFKRGNDYRPYAYYEKYFSLKTGNNDDVMWMQCRVNGEGITYLSKRYG